MDCVIRVIKGTDTGLVVKLPQGQTVIGRNNTAAVRLSAANVSWEHAVITRSGEDYTLENLSAFGTFVDGAKITAPARLRLKAQIRVGDDTVLRLDPGEAEAAALARRRMLVWLLTAMIAVAVGLLGYVLVTSSGDQPDNWDKAYDLVHKWMERQETAGKLPRDTVDMFDIAWRLEFANDFKNAEKHWVRARLALEKAEERLRLSQLSVKRNRELYKPDRPTVLDHMLHPGPDDPSENGWKDEDLAAATIQFVDRRLKYCSAKAKEESVGLAP
jgi:pSer/pThr/pTyr-binding forkhead associated (FHA) protein